ncbi:MAG: hypothetical protein GY719_10485 [bacterium]|nr:hypothetical protein [bacterium]
MKTDREVKILLTKAAKDPYYVFTNSDCLSVDFCTRFFEQCNEVIFDDPAEALERTFIARRLATESRDPHLLAKATAMVATGYRIEALYTKAEQFMLEAESLARGCSCCLAGVYRRKGVLHFYQREFRKGYDVLSRSIELYRRLDDLEGVGRVLIHRGPGVCMLGRIDEALREEREGLELLTGESPSRYYIAGITNMAAILAHSEDEDPARYHQALADLGSVTNALKGEKRRHEHVRVLLRWIKGLLFAKKGDRRNAFRLLASARNGLERLNMQSEVLAICADIAKLYKTGTVRANDDQVVELATHCLERLHPGDQERAILEELRLCPELPAIESLRAAVSCRVPALL